MKILIWSMTVFLEVPERNRAETEKEKALALFDAGNDYSQTIIFDFNNKLLDLPRATELQRELVSNTDEFLKRLEKHSAGDDELQETIMEDNSQMGVIAQNLGKIQEGHHFYEEAHRIAEHLAAKNSDNITYKKELAYSHDNLGNSFLIQGKFDDAIRQYNVGMKIKKELSATPDNLHDKALSHMHLGDAFLYQGNLSEATREYNLAYDLNYKILQNSPKEDYIIITLSNTYQRLFSVYLEENNILKAEELSHRNKEIVESLSKNNPSSRDIERKLALAYFDIAKIYHNKKKNKNALENAKLGLSILERLSLEDPQNISKQADKINAMSIISVYLRLMGEMDKAIDLSESAMNLCRKFLQVSPDYTELLNVYISTCFELATINWLRKHNQEADALLNEVKSTADKLLQLNSHNARALTHIIQSFENIGKNYLHLGNYQACEKMFLSSLETYGALKKLKISNFTADDRAVRVSYSLVMLSVIQNNEDQAINYLKTALPFIKEMTVRYPENKTFRDRFQRLQTTWDGLPDDKKR